MDYELGNIPRLSEADLGDTGEVNTLVAVPSKFDLLGVGISATTYGEATDIIIAHAEANESFGVSALAVHGLMTAAADPGFNDQIASLGLVTPDGQPVRWALNYLHETSLPDRVCGPRLTWHVIEAAAERRIGIYLYGSTPNTCNLFQAEIMARFPTAIIADIQPDRFREATEEEDAADIQRIVKSGAGIVLVGRGCPRQERWVADHIGKVPAAMLAVGAAFDYGAGLISEPPELIQRAGLHWAWRLAEEPKRLWRRYLETNVGFIAGISKQVWAKWRGNQ